MNQKIRDLQDKRALIEWNLHIYGNLPELEKQLERVELELDCAWQKYRKA